MTKFEEKKIRARLATQGTEINSVKAESANLELLKAVRAENVTRTPMISFVSDDGMVSDYNILRPLAIEHNVPFCTAVATGLIGQTTYGVQHMTSEQLLELYNDYGWELLSHSHNHVRMGDQTEAVMRTECVNSINTLKSLGIDCNGFVYPQGSTSALVRRVMKDYFKYAIRVEDAALTVNTDCIASFHIVRCNLGSYFDPARAGYSATNTLAYYKELVDECIAKNAWLVFEMHTYHEDFDTTQQQHLDDLITYIKTTSAKIVTTNDAYKIFGNHIESGDFLGKQNVSGYAVNKLGQTMYGKQESFANEYAITNLTPPNAFALNKTTTYTVSDYDGINNNHGFPTKYGILITRCYRAFDTSSQIWHAPAGIYYRFATNTTTWGSWSQVDENSRIINYTDPSVTVNKLAHDNKYFVLNKADGQAVTLPAATGSGFKITFIIGTTITSNSTTIKVTGNDVMIGNAMICNDTDASVSGFECASDSDTITFNGATTGGIKGDKVELIDIATDTWQVNIKGSATGSEATPFSATV